jgi:type II secretory pathway pseudopilin PulG
MNSRLRFVRVSQKGYILVQLLALVTVMGILLTKAMPSVIAEVQRDQEEELIFRGEAIRNALRRYKAVTGGYPTRLEDLMKVRPRILRQLYKDPMTKEGDWDVVTLVQPGASGNAAGLPIVAVRSRSERSGFKLYQNGSVYSDWVFAASDEYLSLARPTATGPAPVPAP